MSTNKDDDSNIELPADYINAWSKKKPVLWDLDSPLTWKVKIGLGLGLGDRTRKIEKPMKFKDFFIHHLVN